MSTPSPSTSPLLFPSLHFPLSYPPFASVPLSSVPLEVGSLKSSYEVWVTAASSPSGVWGRAPAEIEFGAF